MVPLFHGSSRFESLILSHHSSFTCECNKEDINDDDDLKLTTWACGTNSNTGLAVHMRQLWSGKGRKEGLVLTDGRRKEARKGGKKGGRRYGGEEGGRMVLSQVTHSDSQPGGKPGANRWFL